MVWYGLVWDGWGGSWMLYNKNSAPDLEEDTLVENTLIIDQSYKWISLQADTLTDQTVFMQ